MKRLALCLLLALAGCGDAPICRVVWGPFGPAMDCPPRPGQDGGDMHDDGQGGGEP